MKLNLQDISSHVQQRTFLSKHPNKKSPDRQALSTSHIEEPLYLHYMKTASLLQAKHHAAIELSLLCPNRDSTPLTIPIFPLYYQAPLYHIQMCSYFSHRKKKKIFL